MPGNEALVRNARERPELVSVPEKTEFAGAYRLNSQPRDVLIYSLLCKFNDLRLLQEILFLGESESICRETVALFPSPVQTGYPSPPPSCEARHATPGFCDVCLRQKYGSRLGHASLTACIGLSCPEEPGGLGLTDTTGGRPMQMNLHCSRLLCIFAPKRSRLWY